MPKSRSKRHGSGKKRDNRPSYNPKYTSRIAKEELREALKSSLTVPQLVELEKQISELVDRNCQKAMETAYTGMWAIALRILHDRFGWEDEQKAALWDASLEYLNDISEGLISIPEMADTLEEDGIRLWVKKETEKMLEES